MAWTKTFFSGIAETCSRKEFCTKGGNLSKKPKNNRNTTHMHSAIVSVQPICFETQGQVLTLTVPWNLKTPSNTTGIDSPNLELYGYIYICIYIYIAYRIVYICVLFIQLFIYTCFFLMYLYLSNTLDSCVWVIEAFSKKNTSTAEPPTLAIPWRRSSGKRCDLQEISGEDLQSGRRCVGWGLIYWFLALGISFVGILEGLLYLLGNSWEGASLIGVVLFDKKG